MTPDELRKRLKELGFTQEQLADKVGSDVRTVRRWMNGERQVPKWLDSWLDMYEQLHPPPK